MHFGAVSYQLDDPGRLMRTVAGRDARRARGAVQHPGADAARSPGAPPSATVLLCYAGAPGTDVRVADAAIEPLLELGTVDRRRPSPSAGTPTCSRTRRTRRGSRWSPATCWCRDLDDERLAAIDAAHRGPAPTAFASASLGGAFARVPGRRHGVRAPRRGGDDRGRPSILPGDRHRRGRGRRRWARGRRWPPRAPAPTSTSRARRRPRTWRRRTRPPRWPGWPRSSAPTTRTTCSRSTTTSSRPRAPGRASYAPEPRVTHRYVVHHNRRSGTGRTNERCVTCAGVSTPGGRGRGARRRRR